VLRADRRRARYAGGRGEANSCVQEQGHIGAWQGSPHRRATLFALNSRACDLSLSRARGLILTLGMFPRTPTATRIFTLLALRRFARVGSSRSSLLGTLGFALSEILIVFLTLCRSFPLCFGPFVDCVRYFDLAHPDARTCRKFLALRRIDPTLPFAACFHTGITHRQHHEGAAAFLHGRDLPQCAPNDHLPCHPCPRALEQHQTLASETSQQQQRFQLCVCWLHSLS
jgi:hypothetical protein